MRLKETLAYFLGIKAVDYPLNDDSTLKIPAIEIEGSMLPK